MPFNRQDKDHRVQWAPIYKWFSESGVICFSESWQTVLMWAHYAEKHTGMVLGFDVSVVESDKVKYIDELLPSPLADGSENWMTADIFKDTIQSKFSGWAYEKEWRLRRPLPAPVDGLHYKPFDEELILREVVIGPRCTLSTTDVADAVGTGTPWDVEVKKARASFGEFEICRDQQVDVLTLPGIGKERREGVALAKALREYIDKKGA